MSLDGVSSNKAEPGQMRKEKLKYLGGGLIVRSVFLERKEKKKFCFKGKSYSEVGMSLWTACNTYIQGVSSYPVRSLTRMKRTKQKNENERENN